MRTANLSILNFKTSICFKALGFAAGILYIVPKHHRKVLGLTLGIFLAWLPISLPVQR